MRERLTLCPLSANRYEILSTRSPVPVDCMGEEELCRRALSQPDLLAACEALLELVNSHNWGEGPARRAAVAAVAKAHDGR